jgi:division protein 1
MILLVRTGQSHRALTGHTGQINVLQFDESHVVTGSGDKTIRVRSFFSFSVSRTHCVMRI